MRIRFKADNKLFKGTPIDIVRRMHDTNHEEYSSLEAYMQKCASRLQEFHGEKISITGESEEQRCQSFLQTLVEKGYANEEKSQAMHNSI